MEKGKKRPNPEEMRCAKCAIRRLAEAKPDRIMSRVWKWHTGWCPIWGAYQSALTEVEEPVIQPTAST